MWKTTTYKDEWSEDVRVLVVALLRMGTGVENYVSVARAKECVNGAIAMADLISVERDKRIKLEE